MILCYHGTECLHFFISYDKLKRYISCGITRRTQCHRTVMFGRYEMKKFLGLLAVTVSLLVTALVLPLTGCGEEENPGDPTDNGIDYTVYVQSLGKRGISDVTVQAILNGAPANSAITDKQGKATLHMDPNEYSIVLSDLPKGYQPSTETHTVNAEKTSLTISLGSSVIQETAPNDFVYSIGDVAYDFTLKSLSSEDLNLTTLLQTKKAVMLNFWATWCSPCVSEFPALMEAYEDYSEKLELIAVNGARTGDTASDAKEAAEKYGLTCPIVKDGGDTITRLFDGGVLTGNPENSGAIPMSVIIDRYGVICFAHVGSMVDAEEIKDIFDQYTRDDYVQDYEDVGNNDGDSETEREKPDVQMPASSEIEAAVNNDNFNFGYYADEDEYSWPWIVSSKDGAPCIVPSNTGKNASYAILYTNVHAQANQVIAFDYWISTEADTDIVYVQVNGGLMHTISGVERDGWKTCYAYVSVEDNDYELSLMYLKDVSDKAGDDTIYVRNMRFCTIQDIENSGASVEIGYSCSTKLNETTHKYDSYITPVYNETDGYYHVNSQDGPLVLADLLHQNTHWSRKSVYELAAEMLEATPQGQNPDPRVERLITYCNYASNSMYSGFSSVNAELYDLLQMMVQKYGETQYDEQWLEICSYLIHYGSGEGMGDPIAGLANYSAFKAQLGENSVTFNRIIVPRGLRFSFTPAQSGVYTIQSTVQMQTAAWIRDADENELAYSDCMLGQTNKSGAEGTGDFRLDYYMEAGTTYYIVVAFEEITHFGDLTFTIDYLAETAQIVTDCTSGVYTTGENGELIIPGIKAEMREGTDGKQYYYTKNGEQIYMDLVNYVFNLAKPLETCIQMGMFDFSSDNEKDYTSDMEAYLAQAKANPDKLVAVDQTLVDIIMKAGTKYEWFFEGVENPWLFFCYYYRTEGPAQA